MGSIEHSPEDLKDVRIALDGFANDVEHALCDLNEYMEYHFAARADVFKDVRGPAEGAVEAAYRLATVVAERIKELWASS